MKATLTATALGALLACTCGGAFAQLVATTTQQGTGNSAFTEQIGISTQRITATIEQIGNNNRVGDPISQTPGVYQRAEHPLGYATAAVRQRGDGNTASIRQERIYYYEVPVLIEQVGNNNTAAVRQDLLTQVDETVLRQTGNNNVASVEHFGSAYLPGFTATQIGSDNTLSFRQEGGQYVRSSITQTGSRNAATVDQGGFAMGSVIEQDGVMNAATVTMDAVEDTTSVIRQFGSGNTATTMQELTLSPGARSEITQSGNNNRATLTQTLSSGTSLIAQTGNDNRAWVTQTGGSGFAASIIQTGSLNSAGIHQH